MGLKLAAFFIIVPLIELALLIKLGTRIGTLDTVLLIVVTGAMGAIMVRAAGIACLSKIQDAMRRGWFPGDELLSGLLILIAGAFLITPGLVTDAAGFALLIPRVRAVVKNMLARAISARVAAARADRDIAGL
jgi:UPF0716 protein FxsA